MQVKDKKEFKEKIINNPGLKIVKFYAEWSGPCQMMMPIYNELANVYNSVAAFYRIDVEKLPMLKKELGVMEIPTILFYKNGVVVDFVNGMISKYSLIAKLENALNNHSSN